MTGTGVDGFTPGELAIIKEVARAIGQEVSAQLREQFESEMNNRCNACEIARKVDRVWWSAKATWAVLAFVTGGLLYLTNSVLTYIKH
jgi:GAF domain-containing protein